MWHKELFDCGVLLFTDVLEKMLFLDSIRNSPLESPIKLQR